MISFLQKNNCLRPLSSSHFDIRKRLFYIKENYFLVFYNAAQRSSSVSESLTLFCHANYGTVSKLLLLMLLPFKLVN